MPTRIGPKLLFAFALLAGGGCGVVAPKPEAPPPHEDDVVFMFWNVENLFDDRDDKRNSVDDPYDNWMAKEGDERKKKLERLVEVILKVNGGRGPDVFTACEVESLRAAELLRDALNAKLPADAAKYEHVAMKELDENAGRHISPCVISRVPIDASRTKLMGRFNLRILETHLTKTRPTFASWSRTGLRSGRTTAQRRGPAATATPTRFARTSNARSRRIAMSITCFAATSTRRPIPRP